MPCDDEHYMASKTWIPCDDEYQIVWKAWIPCDNECQVASQTWIPCDDEHHMASKTGIPCDDEHQIAWKAWIPCDNECHIASKLEYHVMMKTTQHRRHEYQVIMKCHNARTQILNDKEQLYLSTSQLNNTKETVRSMSKAWSLPSKAVPQDQSRLPV